MKKLFLLSMSVLFTVGLMAQKTNFSGADGQIEYSVSVEELKDKTNDNFYAYYSLEIKNTSNSEVTFTPVFDYKNNQGDTRSSLTNDGDQTITLAPGETIKGDRVNSPNLTLFKEFLVGNSGKKAADDAFTLVSVKIKY